MNRPSKNDRSTIPWVIDTNHIVGWIRKKMPVKHKNKTMYLSSTDPIEYGKNKVVLHEKMKRDSYLIHVVDINDITLLIE
jgi:hypothetical protein